MTFCSLLRHPHEQKYIQMLLLSLFFLKSTFIILLLIIIKSSLNFLFYCKQTSEVLLIQFNRIQITFCIYRSTKSQHQAHKSYESKYLFKFVFFWFGIFLWVGLYACTGQGKFHSAETETQGKATLQFKNKQLWSMHVEDIAQPKQI